MHLSRRISTRGSSKRGKRGHNRVCRILSGGVGDIVWVCEVWP